eukprot:TRINITY_DN1383_c0_g1_i12.p1 TRINITY_DN1383_c0_g1~~TRINITY_DN1383_c0_g1_i12.p1  ORF type:complete len:122 (+),score=2.63 TRINITY_DN1383_c0_g1_i12:252-617(+)
MIKPQALSPKSCSENDTEEKKLSCFMGSIFKHLCVKEARDMTTCARIAKKQTATQCIFELKDILKCAESHFVNLALVARDIDQDQQQGSPSNFTHTHKVSFRILTHSQLFISEEFYTESLF